MSKLKEKQWTDMSEYAEQKFFVQTNQFLTLENYFFNFLCFSEYDGYINNTYLSSVCFVNIFLMT